VPDNLGTPRAITNSAGTAIWRWDQVTGSTTTGGSEVFGQGSANTDPDGNGTHVTFNPRFPGQCFDAESGLHYNYFRDYEPGTGRYVQSDPVGLWGGVTTYLYVDGDPSFRIDPFGLRGAPTRPPPVRTNRLTQAIREALQNSQRRADGVRPAPDPSNPGPQPPPRLPPGGPDPYNNNPLEDQLKVCFGFMTFDNGCVQPDEYRWEPARRCINLKCPSPWPPSCPQNDPPQQHMFASGSSSRGGCYCVDWDWTAVKVRN
jgi:RHS repeat-associated protein